MFKFIVLAALMVAVASAVSPGAQLFAGFLAANPEIKAQFPKFKDVANADLVNNADLQAHAEKIFNIVRGLPGKTDWSDVDALSAQHKAIGQTNKAFFQAFRTYVFNVYNAAWDKFFEHLFSKF
jgi:hypothetical protein